MKAATCVTCPFYVKRDIQRGECHGAPPSAFPQMTPDGQMMGAMSIWPPVMDSAWCAKHPLRESSGMARALFMADEAAEQIDRVAAPVPAEEVPAPPVDTKPRLVTP